MDKMTRLLKDLAQARSKAAEAKATREAMIAELMSSPQVAATYQDESDAETKAHALRQDIGEEATRLMALTGKKKVHDKVTIKEQTSYTYAEEAAIAWAEKNIPMAIKRSIDKALFKKAIDDKEPPAFVTIEKSYQVQIAQDLTGVGDDE